MFRRNDFFPREKETENLFHPRVGLFILEIPSRGPKKEERKGFKAILDNSSRLEETLGR